MKTIPVFLARGLARILDTRFTYEDFASVTDNAWMVGFRNDTAAWRRIRLAVLERDGYVCQLRGEGCTVDATEVDHVVAIADGGGLYEPDNLRGSCKWCNSSRGGKLSKAKERAKSTTAWRPSREW